MNIKQPSTPRSHLLKRGDHLKLIRDLPRFYALGLMYEKPRYGYEIISCFRRDLDWRVSPSLVYPFLKDLESSGLVVAGPVKRGTRGKRIFRLTDLGKAACRNVFLQFSEKIAKGILCDDIHTCTGCGRRLLGGCYSETINGKLLSFCCQSCASSCKKKEAEIVTH